MLLFWRWKLVYSGASCEESAKLCNALREHHIPYRNQVKAPRALSAPLPGDSTSRQRFSGEPSPLRIPAMYYVYVLKKDADKISRILYPS